MQIDQQEYTQKLAETHYRQSISFYTEIIDLQVKLDFAEKEISRLNSKLIELENKEINVDSTSDI